MISYWLSGGREIRKANGLSGVLRHPSGRRGGGGGWTGDVITGYRVVSLRDGGDWGVGRGMGRGGVVRMAVSRGSSLPRRGLCWGKIRGLKPPG